MPVTMMFLVAIAMDGWNEERRRFDQLSSLALACLCLSVSGQVQCELATNLTGIYKANTSWTTIILTDKATFYRSLITSCGVYKFLQTFLYAFTPVTEQRATPKRLRGIQGKKKKKDLWPTQAS